MWHQIRDSEEIQTNITPLCSQKSQNSQKLNKISKSHNKKDKKNASKEEISTIAIEESNTMLADYIIQASGGCILYADRVLNLFRTGKLQVKLPSSFNMVGMLCKTGYFCHYNFNMVKKLVQKMVQM